MRYIAKSKINFDKAVRLMINESKDGIYIFGYDTMIDSFSNWDYFYDNVNDSMNFASEEFGITENDWIQIDSEKEGCQQDWIENVISKHNNGVTHFFTKSSGQIIDTSNRTDTINGMTVNERLFVVGLINEFDKSRKHDKIKCRKILEYISVDEESIQKII
jgi:hypothetical protein